MVHHSDQLPLLSFKDIIGKRLGSDIESILKIFSEVKGISIIQFITLQKVDRVKELLLYDDLSLVEIAEKLQYKNEQYLIAQFKKHTGLSPNYFKKLREERMSILQKHKTSFSKSKRSNQGSICDYFYAVPKVGSL